jgi:glucuronate isomerase
VPTYIAADLRARVQALPKIKLLGYYSDAYKLEFILPKFNMYRRILAEVLSGEVIGGRGWSVDEALQLAKLILIDNPKRIFGRTSPSSKDVI